MSSVTTPVVWVQYPDYPWWPCLVLTKEQVQNVGAEMPNDGSIAILFCGSHELGYVDPKDPLVCAPFENDEGDERVMAARREGGTLLEALEEALAHCPAPSQPFDEAAPLPSARRQHKAEKKEKKEKKAAEKAEKKERKAAEKAMRREAKRQEKIQRREKRTRVDSSGSDSAHSSDGDLLEGAQATGHRRRGRPHGKPTSSAAAHQDRRQTILDALGAETPEEPPLTFPKRPATDEELTQIAPLLEQAITSQDLATMRQCLSQLSNVSVTYQQLLETGIGVVVGHILASSKFENAPNDGFASRCLRPLAEALLRYWFTSLSSTVKQRLQENEQVEVASVASNVDDREPVEEMALLDSIGVRIEETFTADEIEAAGVADASAIASEMTALLEALGDDSHERVAETLRVLEKPDNKELRIQLLKGSVAAKDLVADPLVVGETPTERVDHELREAANIRAHTLPA